MNSTRLSMFSTRYSWDISRLLYYSVGLIGIGLVCCEPPQQSTSTGNSHPPSRHQNHPQMMSENVKPKNSFQYMNVPSKYKYNFGFKRGNDEHTISRFEEAKDGTFRTKVQWKDKDGASGSQYYEYNHGDKNKGNDYNQKGKGDYEAKGTYSQKGSLYGEGGYASGASHGKQVFRPGKSQHQFKECRDGGVCRGQHYNKEYPLYLKPLPTLSTNYFNNYGSNPWNYKWMESGKTRGNSWGNGWKFEGDQGITYGGYTALKYGSSNNGILWNVKNQAAGIYEGNLKGNGGGYGLEDIHGGESFNGNGGEYGIQQGVGPGDGGGTYGVSLNGNGEYGLDHGVIAGTNPTWHKGEVQGMDQLGGKVTWNQGVYNLGGVFNEDLSHGGIIDATPGFYSKGESYEMPSMGGSYNSPMIPYISFGDDHKNDVGFSKENFGQLSQPSQIEEINKYKTTGVTYEPQLPVKSWKDTSNTEENIGVESIGDTYGKFSLDANGDNIPHESSSYENKTKLDLGKNVVNITSIIHDTSLTSGASNNKTSLDIILAKNHTESQSSDEDGFISSIANFDMNGEHRALLKEIVSYLDADVNRTLLSMQ